MISFSQIINWNKWIEMEIEEIDLIEKLIGIVRERYVKFSGIVLDLKHLLYYDNWNHWLLNIRGFWRIERLVMPETDVEIVGCI